MATSMQGQLGHRDEDEELKDAGAAGEVFTSTQHITPNLQSD
jgi:hypothetical protein